MAYAPAALTAAEIAGFANDKPMMVVQQLLTPGTALWSANGTTGGTNKTDENYPITRAYDDIGSLQSRSDSETVSHRYLVFDLGSGNEISFDTCLILNHNLNSAVFTSVALEISNDDFSSEIEIYKYTVSGTSDDRLLCMNLNSAGGSSTYDPSGTAQRYSGVRYVRLKIIDDASDALACGIGELVLGTRYQLQRNPDLNWNNKNELSKVTDFASFTGLTKRYVFYRGQAVRSVAMGMSDSAEIAVVDNWFNDINEGTRPFVWIDTPSSGAEARLMLLDDAALNFPLVGPYERTLQFSVAEQPPFLSRE